MSQYLMRRMLLFIPTMLLATIMVFALFSIVPGDAAVYLLTGEDAGGRVTNDDFERLRKDLGLDRPVYVQYADWLWGVVRGDLGESLYYGEPFGFELLERFARTFELAMLAIGMAFVAAVPLGILSAMKQDTGVDYASRVIALVGIAMPTFWIGVLVIYGLAYGTGWLPPLEYAHLWDDPWQNLQLMLLPAAVVGFHDMAFTARGNAFGDAGSYAGRLYAHRPLQGTARVGGSGPTRAEKCFAAGDHRFRLPVWPVAGRSNHRGADIRGAWCGQVPD